MVTCRFFFYFVGNSQFSPRTITHHRWYRLHFSNYPKERKALIPFLL
ncbi:hypothetical protein [Legionella steelei]